MPKLAEIQAAAEAPVEQPRSSLPAKTNSSAAGAEDDGQLAAVAAVVRDRGTVAAGVIIGMFFLSNSMHSGRQRQRIGGRYGFYQRVGDDKRGRIRRRRRAIPSDASA